MYGYGRQYGKIFGGSIGQTLADAYKVRVLVDGGTYENNICLVAFLTSLTGSTDGIGSWAIGTDFEVQ